MLENLKILRKSKKLTQKEMAEFLGITQNNYSYWETGKVKIDNVSLQKLATFFNVSIDFILGQENQKLSNNVLSYNRFNEACIKGGIDASKLEKLQPEQLDLIVSLVKDMLKNRNNQE